MTASRCWSQSWPRWCSFSYNWPSLGIRDAAPPHDIINDGHRHHDKDDDDDDHPSPEISCRASSLRGRSLPMVLTEVQSHAVYWQESPITYTTTSTIIITTITTTTIIFSGLNSHTWLDLHTFSFVLVREGLGDQHRQELFKSSSAITQLSATMSYF